MVGGTPPRRKTPNSRRTAKTPREDTRLPLRLRHTWLLFWPALAVWSWLLVKPNPFPELARRLSAWDDLLPFLAAKALHTGVYAALTGIGLIGGGRRWAWVVALMLAHGVLTELGQYYGDLWFDTKRTGCVRDVLVDWTGVAVGYGAWRFIRHLRPKVDPLEMSKNGEKTDREGRSEQVG